MAQDTILGSALVTFLGGRKYLKRGVFEMAIIGLYKSSSDFIQ